jgi:hypothetical protein
MSYTTPESEVPDPGGPVNISKTSLPESAAGGCALERLPHISKRVCLLWGHPEFDAFTSHLLMDSRDGKRQGLPWDVAEEILFLAELRVVKRAIIASGVTGQPFWEVFNEMLKNAEAAQARLQHEAWDDPLMNKDVSRALRPQGELSRPPADLARTNTNLTRTNTNLTRTNTKKQRPPKRGWLSRLLG